MLLLLWLAPVFLVFEVVQLVASERYLGVKQIARNGDPRELAISEVASFAWIATLFAYWLWMIALAAAPFSRLHALTLLAVSLLGFLLRRNTTIKWTLVILTFEGAIRVGLLVSVIVILWRRW